MIFRRPGLILVLLLASCASREEPGRPDLYLLPLGVEPAPKLEDGSTIIARVELAFTPRDRATGLMGRTTLAPDTGMLFLYPGSAERSFWMKNTLLPLSIAFVDEGGRIVRILEMTPDPGDGNPLPHYGSGEPALNVLEMEAGWFARKGIREGDRVLLHPRIQAITPR